MGKAAKSKPGPRLFDESGVAVALGPRIAGGGEGAIFELAGDPAGVVKVYHRPAPERLEKARCMLNAVPEDPFRFGSNHISFCWPERLLFDKDGVYAGFVMPRLDIGAHQPIAMYWDSESRAAIAPGFTWKYLVVAGANMASLLELLHAQGHVLGDLNEENLLINDRALVTVVDCDSMQIRDAGTGLLFRSPVAREAYISPERLNVSLADCDRTREDDYWALAILLFQMLMEGQHPTDGIGYPEERRERIRHGIFPLLGHAGFESPKYALPLEVLPEELRGLFERCFGAGHADPSARPTAAEWRIALGNLAGSLTQCTISERHAFSAHLPACPWCEQQDHWGIDRFVPASLAPVGRVPGKQHALPSAGAPPASSSQPAVTTAGSWFPGGFGTLKIWSAGAAACIGLALLPGLLKTTAPVAPPPHKTPSGPVGPVPPPPVVPVVQPKVTTVPPVQRRVHVVPDKSKVSPPVVPVRTGTDVQAGKSVVPPTVANLILPPVNPPAVVEPPPKTPPERIVPPALDPVVAPVPDPTIEQRKLAVGLQVRLAPVRPEAPRRGTLIWSGPLSKNVPVVIGNNGGVGAIRGDPFPGSPIIIEEIQPSGLAVTEPPSLSNGFQRLVLRSGFSRNQVITISWRTQ